MKKGLSEAPDLRLTFRNWRRITPLAFKACGVPAHREPGWSETCFLTHRLLDLFQIEALRMCRTPILVFLESSEGPRKKQKPSEEAIKK